MSSQHYKIDATLMKERVRMYRVVWIRDDNKTRGVLFPGPLTHREACVALGKVTPHPWRRDMLEEIEEVNRDQA